jgi:hypothetical protein
VPIDGYYTEDYCGQWRVDVSAVNPDTGQEQIFDTKNFWILESPAYAPEISVALAPLADGGGVMSNAPTEAVILTNVTVSGNSASVFGGGILNNGGFVLTNTIVSNNSADGGGGGMPGATRISSGGNTWLVSPPR